MGLAERGSRAIFKVAPPLPVMVEATLLVALPEL
jgi:hypothetical protein